MTWPTDQATTNPDTAAVSINSTIRSTLATVRAWQAWISANNAGPSDSSKEAYNQIAALRQYLSINKDIPGLGAAYKTRFPSASATFDPIAEFVPVKAALDDFITWFQTNWPKTAAGNPSFDSYDVTGQLIPYAVPLTGATKTLVLAKITTLLAAFSP